MKKLISILIGLALVISVNAQFQNSGGMFLRTGSSFTTAVSGSSSSTEPPSFLSSDGYTFSWLVADADNLTLNGTQITAVTDIGPNSNDWTGSGSTGPQWDSANEEIDFTNAVSAGLSVNYTPGAVPVTVYIVVNIRTHSDGREVIMFGVPSPRISQGGDLNSLVLYAGNWNLFITNDDGTYGLITAVLNGASSYFQWNDDTAQTGNAGTGAPSMISLGYDTGNATMSVKEVIVRSTAETALNRASVQEYLNDKYSIY